MKNRLSKLLLTAQGGGWSNRTLKTKGTRFSILILTFLTIAGLSAVWLIPSTADESVTAISSLAELKTFRDAVNNGNDYEGKTVKLTANINLEGSESNKWTPIGNSGSKPFSGKFDGQGHTISGLYVNSADAAVQGFFGVVGNADNRNNKVEVSNLTVSGKVSGNTMVGIVAGEMRYSTIKNCRAEGSVSGNEWTGGIAGYTICGTISNCTSTCSVIGGKLLTNGGTSAGGFGGIVGAITLYNSTDIAEVSNCTATGNVSASGGNIGVVVGSSGEEYVTVKNCVAIGTVTGTGGKSFKVGGVIGSNSGTVTNCAATGSVSGDSKVGGVVGSNGTVGTISNCAATGSVNGTGTYIGGIAGENDYHNPEYYHPEAYGGVITNCGWLKNGVNKAVGSGDQGTDAVSFDSKESIVAACLPDPAPVTVANGGTAKTTLKAWPAGKAITTTNYTNLTAAISSTDVAALAMNGVVATLTGKKLGFAAVDFEFTLKPTHFTGDCSGLSTDVKLAPSTRLTVESTGSTEESASSGGSSGGCSALGGQAKTLFAVLPLLWAGYYSRRKRK